MARSSGYRRRTRALLKRHGSPGLISILREYHQNDKVVIKIDPSESKGMPHRRYNGLVGTVEEVGRRSIKVRVPVGNKIKTVIARKEHISPLGGS